MQADTMLPEQQRRHYRGVTDAFLRILKEDGVRGLYRGVGPNVGRAMSLNMGMLASNDQVLHCRSNLAFESDLKADRIIGEKVVLDTIQHKCSRRGS